MIIHAFDPGTSKTGWASVDVRGGGRLPITTTYLGGDHVPSRHGDIRGLLHVADVVAVEKLEGIAFPTKGGGVVASLIASSNVAGGIAWSAATLGIRVVEMSAREWRRLVCRNPSASDAQVKEAVERLVHGLPKRTNCHVRDAVGLALAVGWHLGGEARRTG